MNIKLLPRIKLHSHPAVHRRSVGLQMRSHRGDKFVRRISSKLEDIIEEHGTEEMVLGMISGLSQQASKGFNQQMDNSSLPNFMRDELRNTFKDECAMADTKVSAQCQIDCNAVFEEHLSLEIKEGKLTTGPIESGYIETLKFHAFCRGRPAGRGIFIRVCLDSRKSSLKYLDPSNKHYSL
jgi:hypothetical protein